MNGWSGMNVVHFALDALAALWIVVTFLPLWRTPRWWVRSFDFPRVQIAVLIVLTMVGLFFFAELRPFGDLYLFAFLGIALAYQLFRILPYTPLWRVQVRPAKDALRGEGFRLLVTNVQMDNPDKERWLRVIQANEADAVFAVETDVAWIEAGKALYDTYPYVVEIPQDNTYGMVLYSRWPIAQWTIKHLIDPDVPSLWATLCSPLGHRVEIVGLHPRPPRPDVGQDSDLRDAELVLAAKTIATMPPERPVVLCGDLNDVAWSSSTRLFQRLSGLLDPRRGRGLYSTFHAKNWLLRWPLDHIFHSDDFTLVELRRVEPYGSDHFGIFVHLQMSPNAEALQKAPEATTDDLETAAEIVAETFENEAELSEEERQERNEADV